MPAYRPPGRHRRKQMAEINVVPYIDVMLVLLVIFMITAPLLTQGVDVELVKAEGRPQSQEAPEPFVLTVDEEGRYFVNDDSEASTAQQVGAKAAAVLRHQPGTAFLVRGDRRVAYEAVVQAMVLLQQAGVDGVGLVTEPPEGG